MAKKEKELSALRTSKIVIISGIVILAAALGAGGMYAYTIFGEKNKTDFERVQEQVSAMMQLPSEVPTFATVSDVAKLNTQPFFSNAQNGDKVLIYPIAKKAVLFRPSTKKIIEVGPINIEPTQTQVAGAQATPSASLAPSVTPTVTPVTIAIYNGTKKTGLTKVAQEQLDKVYSSGEVTARKDAKGNYEKTIVIPLSEKEKASATAVASAIKASVATLPAGEAKPDAAILIILGEDYQK